MAVAAPMRRSSSASRADGQPEVVRERMGRRERAGDEPAPEEPLGDRGRSLGAVERDEHEVRDAGSRPPADRSEGRAQPLALGLDALDRGRHDRRIPQHFRGHGHRRGRDGARRPVRLHRGDHRPRRERESDPEPGEGVGLAQGPDDDEARIRRPGAGGGSSRRTRRRPRRGRRPGRRVRPARRRRGGPRGDRRSRRRARPGRSGCSGCTARPGRPRARWSGSGPGRSPSRRRLPAVERGRTRAPRCSVSTRYIA